VAKRITRWQVLLGIALLVGLGGALIYFREFPISPQMSSQTVKSDRAIKIMPLGDSITDGYFVPGGYRIDLWQYFTDKGYQINFVGSLTNGPNSLPDKNHEGHSGWTIAQIRQGIELWLERSQPNVILLKIGTNDMFQVNFASAPARLQDLLSRMKEILPEAKILVASIPRINEPSFNQKVIDYNQEIAALLQREEYRDIVFVDIYQAIAVEDLPDGVHPNSLGYKKMARSWIDALEPILASWREKSL